MLHDPKTVIGSDFDQETAEKIAPPFIPRLELANCKFRQNEIHLVVLLRLSASELLQDDLHLVAGGLKRVVLLLQHVPIIKGNNEEKINIKKARSSGPPSPSRASSAASSSPPW